MSGWPFRARDRELDRIVTTLTGDAAGGLILVGPAGVGKSRLAEEALARLAAAGFATVAAVATRATTDLPLGALAPLLPAELPAPGGAALRAAADAIAALAGQRRLVLLADDAHLLDDASAALLLQLVRTGGARLLLTVRTGEPMPEPVHTLWKDRYVRRWELPPLTASGMGQALAAELAGPVARPTLDRLCQAVDGNMLLLRELVDASREAGALRADGGVWRLADHWPIPPQLVELIDTRLGRLDGAERRVVELLAHGEPLDLAVLTTLAPTDVVERLEARGLLTAAADPGGLRLRLAHPLYAETIRAGCPALRARERRRELAEAVEAYGLAHSDAVLRVAVWRLDAGLRTDPEILLAAARRAWASYDLPLAERLGRAALDSGGGPAATHLLALVLTYAVRPAEAERMYAVADAATEQERVEQTVARIINLAWNLDRADDAFTLLDEVGSALADPQARAALDASRALLLARNCRLTAATNLATSVLTGADGTPRSCGEAHLGLAIAAAQRGRFRDSLAAAEQARRYADAAPWLDVWADQASCLSLLLSGQLAVAERTYTARYETSVAAGEPDAEVGGWCTKVGWTHRWQGRVADAVQWLREGDALQRGEEVPLTLTVAELAHAAALAGDAELAASAFARAEQQRRGSREMPRFWVEFARPWVAAVTGSHRAPARLALAAADEARELGASGFEAVCLYDVVRLGAAAVVVDRLADLAGEVDGELVSRYARHAAALVGRDAAALDALAREFAEVGAILFAAEAAAGAARAHRAAGRTASARAAAAHSGWLAAQCQGARTPALATTRVQALTSRERQVALLAMTGLSSGDIATQLNMSVRTVDNHLGRVYHKLGVSGRGELRDALAADQENPA